MSEGVTCDDCYMRLQRQATEWGKKYKFRFSDQVNLDLVFLFFSLLFCTCFFILYLARSCADLKIVADESAEEVKKIRKVGNYE